VVFVLSQRRSGAVAFGVGVIMLLIVLWRLRPRALLVVGPVTLVLAATYLAAFWNSTGAIGFGAQAVKSVIASDQLDQSDTLSNLYRQIEAYDIWFTIRAMPFRGVGFGNPFFQPWPLPNLPGVEFRHYIPHNSLLWVWLKLGFAGFVATMYLLAKAVQLGSRRVVHLGSGDAAAIMTGSVAYVVMYVVFAYVDIAWDPRSMVFLAVASAWCADFPESSPRPDTAPSESRSRPVHS
jgi:O-antigen ligase